MSESLPELQRRLQRWAATLQSFPVPGPLVGKVSPRDACDRARSVARRIAEGGAAPLRIAFFGPTGAGKSKLFNSVLGEPLSPSGYRRPFTRRAVYYVHREHDAVADRAAGDVRRHDRDDWKRRLLIDTPDFDGIEDPNHEVAERVYLEADVLIFVTDVHKYADASTWHYIDRLRLEGRPTVFVINKVREPGPAEDFGQRLADAFGGDSSPGPVVVIGHYRQEDARLIDPSDAGLTELRARLDALLDDVRALLVESFRVDLDRLLEAWRGFEEPLRAYRSSTEELSRRLEEAFARARSRLGDLLESRVDAALKQEVYQEMLERLEKIDVLRYPRKLLAMPWVGARKLLAHYFPALGDREEKTVRGDAPQDRNYPALESIVFAFGEEVLEALRDESQVAPALDDETIRGLRLASEELEVLYRERVESYREWAAEEARKIASKLTSEHKVKFILSQVIYNSVIIGLQVKTFGLSPTELVADGILSPLVAKAVGMYISSEQVATFESAARRRHLELLEEILEVAHRRFAEFLATLEPELAPLESIAEEVEKLAAERGVWVDRYRQELESTGARSDRSPSLHTAEGEQP